MRGVSLCRRSSGISSVVLMGLGVLPLVLASLGTAQAETLADAQPLATLTVTATMSAHDTRTAPASVTVVTRDELDRRNADDVLEAVRGEPGITLTGHGN